MSGQLSVVSTAADRVRWPVSEERSQHVQVYPQAPVLVVDDEEFVLKSMENVLRMNGISNVRTTRESAEVERIITERDVCVMVLDLTMPGLSGEEVLRRVRPQHPELAIVVVTGNMDVSTAVECMKLGASDYLVKPVESSRLVTTIRRIVETWELRRENAALADILVSPELKNPEAFSDIVTASSRMRSIMLYVDAVARTSKPVLITGPTGAGKELIAQSVHRASGRPGDLVSVNVAGFDDTMFADTLFGHARGAFTGADRARTGLVEAAGAGTLFLEEIGDLTAASQVKLLRLVETTEYYPLGVDVPRKSHARIVAATNRELGELVASGQFRRDLFYRLQTHHVGLPPLSERPEDLPVLVEHFLAEACAELGKKQPAIPDELYALLGAYHFPGNVRELKSMVFEAASVFDTPAGQAGAAKRRSGVMPLTVFRERTGLVEADPAARVASLLGFAAHLPTLRQATELLIEEALRRSNKNQTVAARLLGISQQALSKRLSRGKRADGAEAEDA
jgi:DNA-binding NtrC family response regulator